MQLKTLYKISAKTSAKQVMNIKSEGNTFVVEWGQEGGKQQTRVTACKGKNIGKSNATSDEAQAKAEALAYHAKKIKSGYSTNPAAPTTVNLPMKVQTYAKHKKKVKFPCWESPKLNGVNATYKLTDTSLELLSRGGEQYPLIEQQMIPVMNIMKELNVRELNGEIYIHGESLQTITGAVKKYREMTDKLEFHIFDVPDIDMIYTSRHTIMEDIEETEFVKVVPVHLAVDHTHLDERHDKYVSEGYEGLIVRNQLGMYEHNTRSNDVFKLKKAVDAEFKVIDHAIDKNGHVVFVCETGDNTFKVKPKGTDAERTLMASMADKYHGAWLKVEYEMLSDDGIPLKPVGIMFRECDADGNPKE